LRGDDDIDIGVIHQSGDLDAFIRELKALGFRAVRFYWGGFLYKVKLVPKDKDTFSHILDLQIYVERNGDYLCPQTAFRKELSPYNRLRKRVLRAKKSTEKTGGKGVKGTLKHLLSYLSTRGGDTVIRNRGKKGLYDYYLWKVPKRFVEAMEIKDGYPVFADADGYLTYRYGDWRTPVSNWSFTRDDRALSPSSHLEIDQLYSKKGQ